MGGGLSRRMEQKHLISNGYNFLEKIGLTTSAGVFLAVLVPASVTLKGWVLSIIWTWFLIDLGVPPISIPEAVGILIIYGFVSEKIESSKTKSSSKKDPLEELSYLLGQMFFAPLLTLAMGYIAHLFL